MKPFAKLLIYLTGLLLAANAAAQQGSLPKQDPKIVHDAVERFLQTQVVGLPGQVTITVGTLDARSNIPACAAPEVFLPSGSRIWGKTTVGVRCTAPNPWTVYISATINVYAEYLTAAVPLAQGSTIGPNDIIKTRGDLTQLPAGILTDPAQAIGRSAIISLSAGTPLRQENLRAQQAVQQNQAVRLVSSGAGFSVTSEGKALNNAAEGQVVQARTANGQVVSGIAKAGGVVEVTY